MIACVSPGSSSADHSLNTIRYADRLKEKSSNIVTTDNKACYFVNIFFIFSKMMTKKKKYYLKRWKI